MASAFEHSLPVDLPGAAVGLFDARRPVFAGSAPGRLDVLGGIADYSGSLVLELPLRERTRVLVQPSDNLSTRVVSVSEGASPVVRSFAHVDWRAIGDIARWGDFERARALFGESSGSRWVAYVLGCAIAILNARRESRSHGWRVLVTSDVPEGKGVSSSAALEVAAMRAFASALGHSMDDLSVARLSQIVENRIAGAPCGIMDQLTSACGEAGKLLAIRCRPDRIEGSIAIPPGLGLWGIDSGVRHEIASVSSDAVDYTSVRVGAFAGRRILRETDPAIDFLAQISPDEYRDRFEALLPESVLGLEFAERYGETGDAVTRIDPERVYAVRVATAHPILENARVERFASLLRGVDGLEDRVLRELGELMFASHASYSACGLGSSGTDRLVELVRQAGPDRGLFGAKITGGGCGGTVAVLGRVEARSAVEDLAASYARERGIAPLVLDPLSPA